jgi:hypothetical protein
MPALASFFFSLISDSLPYFTAQYMFIYHIVFSVWYDELGKITENSKPFDLDCSAVVGDNVWCRNGRGQAEGET